jgi:hypothetical protein
MIYIVFLLAAAIALLLMFFLSTDIEGFNFYTSDFRSTRGGSRSVPSSFVNDMIFPRSTYQAERDYENRPRTIFGMYGGGGGRYGSSIIPAVRASDAPSDAPISMASTTAPESAPPESAPPGGAPPGGAPQGGAPESGGVISSRTMARPGLSQQALGLADDFFSAITVESNNEYQEPVPDGYIYIGRDMLKNRPARFVNVGSNDFNSNPCNFKSIMKTEFKDGLCKNNSSETNKKCKLLSKEGCNLSSCCVSLDGTMCVAGNVDGPTFLTDSGGTIDYEYYLFKNQCYAADGGPCAEEKSSDYMKACGAYNAHSKNISKECILQMAIAAGCPNSNPEWYANLDMKDMKYQSKSYMEDQIKSMIKSLKNTADSNRNSTEYSICYGTSD